MRVNRLRRQDMDEVSALAQAIIATTRYYTAQARIAEQEKFGRRALLALLRDPDALLLVATEGERVIGFCAGRYDCATFWLDWIGVAPDRRRAGVAARLLERLERALRGKTHKIWCDSRANNKESIAFLKKHDFHRLALLKDHWYRQDYLLWHKLI